MLSLDDALTNLRVEIDCNNIHEINKLEEVIANNFLNILEKDSFFELPLKTIHTIVSLVNFDEYKHNNSFSSFIPQLINKTKEYHPKNNEIYFYLDSIKCSYDTFSLKDCINIFKCFDNSCICKTLVDLINDNNY